MPDDGRQPAFERHVVVVLSWNGLDDALACVESLLVGSPEVGVLVVDNGSFDGTLEAVVARWPTVHTLQTGENQGFAGGMNSGIRHALGHGAECVTILNNDTLVPPGAMSELERAAGERIAVSPTVVYRDAPGEIWFGGGTLDLRNGFPFHTPSAELDPCQAGLRATELLAGCCITASRQVWQRVGLFDDRFFLNFEDSEWSVRAGANGVGLAVVCDTRILHSVSASFRGAAATLGSYYYIRNGLLFNRLVGASWTSRVVFLRRRVLPGLPHDSARETLRSLLVLGWAVAAYTMRRFGAAPRSLQKLARSWNRPRSQMTSAKPRS
ncbi:MAG: glycosyltransferase family 2 protein [Microbacteriaceae bacterium]|nr:MAG: glycosyltransferase family 2 protein [Microbacteriaceae bacterium]